MINRIFTTIGYIATTTAAIWGIIKIYTFFFKPKTNIGFSFRELPLTNSTYETVYKKLLQGDFSWEINIKEKLMHNDGNIEETNNGHDTKNISVCQFEFKNTGKTIIKGSDFYQNEMLGLKSTPFVILATINDSTPQYINAHINNLDRNVIEIQFDQLKPNDSISFSVVKFDTCGKLEVRGKSDKINKIKPIDTETLKHYCNNLSFIENEILVLKEFFNIFRQSVFFFVLVLIALSIIAKFLVKIYIMVKSGGTNV